MKPLLYWKYADLAGQVLMLLPIICVLSPVYRSYAAISYITVGLWQSLSCALTAAAGIRPEAASRSFYGQLLTWLLGIFTLCAGLYFGINALNPAGTGALGYIAKICGGIMLVEASGMLFLLPVMAIWYLTITIEEIAVLRGALRHRAEIHWKL